MNPTPITPTISSTQLSSIQSNNIQSNNEIIDMSHFSNPVLNEMGQKIRGVVTPVESPQTNFVNLPIEIKVKIVKDSTLSVLRNLKATNSFMREICRRPFAQQATKILENAVKNLKQDLAAGNTRETVATLEYLNILGLLTENEIAYIRNKGVNFDYVVDGKNIVEKLIIANRFSGLELLVKMGTTLNSSPVHEAEYPTQFRGNLLALAVRYDKFGDSIELLIRQACSIDAQNGFGETALHLAAEYKNFVAIEILLYYGADCNMTDLHNRTALSTIIAMNQDNPQLVKMLLEAGAKTDIVSKGGSTPLSQAVLQASKENRLAHLTTILDYEDEMSKSVKTTLKAYEIAKTLKHMPTIAFLEERLSTSPYRIVNVCTIL